MKVYRRLRSLLGGFRPVLESIPQFSDLVVAGQPAWVVTLNPEIVSVALADPTYRRLIDNATHYTVDGVGLQILMRWLIGTRVRRVTGAGLVQHSLGNASTPAPPDAIAFVGPNEDQIRRAAAISGRTDLTSLYDGVIDEDNMLAVAQACAKSIDERGIRIAYVCLGVPKQDKLISLMMDCVRQPGVVFIGTGGALDVYVGDQRAGPAFAARFGIEWVFRTLGSWSRLKRLLRTWYRIVLYG